MREEMKQRISDLIDKMDWQDLYLLECCVLGFEEALQGREQSSQE